MKPLLCFGVVALTAFTLVPDPAHAQDEMALRTDEQLVIDVDRSVELFDEARQIEQRAPENRLESSEWIEAAELYVASAQHRPYGDAEAYTALIRAGDILARADDRRAARRAYAAAGVRALERGHVYEAGIAFANAADLSQRNRQDNRMALDYYRMAHRLSESPMLTDEQTRHIRTRLGLDEGLARRQ